MSMSREEFKAAFREVISSEFAHIPTDESSIDFTFSEKFIKRMNKLIRAQRKSYYKFINTAATRSGYFCGNYYIVFCVFKREGYP